MMGYIALWSALTLGKVFYERALTDGSWEQVVSWAVAQATALIAARLFVSAAP